MPHRIHRRRGLGLRHLRPRHGNLHAALLRTGQPAGHLRIAASSTPSWLARRSSHHRHVQDWVRLPGHAGPWRPTTIPQTNTAPNGQIWGVFMRWQSRFMTRSESARARTLVSADPGACHRPLNVGGPASRWPSSCAIKVHPSNILLPGGWPRPWTESWTGSPEHPVRWEHSGTRVLPSVQAGRLGRFAGFLVMRRSSVRFR